MLGQIFKLKNLRRYPASYGQLRVFTERIDTVPQRFYGDLNGTLTPFPVSLLVQASRVFRSLLYGLAYHSTLVRQLKRGVVGVV